MFNKELSEYLAIEDSVVKVSSLFWGQAARQVISGDIVFQNCFCGKILKVSLCRALIEIRPWKFANSEYDCLRNDRDECDQPGDQNHGS